MSDGFQEDLHFEAADDAADLGEGLLLDIDGYEGPLHLLLELARKQKVDLARISILALAEQYLAFIKAAEDLRIELAADYLVMASWLAYLKSRLILPITDSETWTSFDTLLPQAGELKDGLPAASVKASSLLAGLELTKEGQMEIRQTGTFAPIYVRAADRKDDENDG